MIDASAPAASWFLWILGSTFLLVYALPLLIAPLRWARVFRWNVERRDPLTLYFGARGGFESDALRAHPGTETEEILLFGGAAALAGWVRVGM